MMLLPPLRMLPVFLIVALTASLFAEQPSREWVTQPLYVLRTHGSTAFSGVLRYDPVTKRYTPVAPLVEGQYPESPADGAVHLGATADRIVLQGADYFEIDIASGRLLRRYESNANAAIRIPLQGTVVTDEQARTLGIPSGIYGFLKCTDKTPSGPILAPCHGDVANIGGVLMRRSVNPADASLTLAKTLPSQFFEVALDTLHRQFWLWTPGLPQWWTLPITNNSIGDPIKSNLQPDANVFALTYHTPTQSLFDLFYLPDHSKQMLQQRSTVDGGATTTIIDPPIDAMTSVPDALPERYVQVIPAVGETPGANGTFWHSDLWLYNPAGDAIDITLRRVARPQQIATRHLDAHASLALRDVLKILGGGPSGDGVTTDALVIDAPYRWGAQLSAYSRTYTSGSDGGTYGQAVPAVPSAVGYSNHVRDFRAPNDVPGFPATIVLDKGDGSRFRHNLGVVNDTDAAFDVRLFEGFHKFTIPVAAHSVTTVNLEQLFTDPNAVLFAADRPAPVWMSMVDNLSGDATFVPFTNLALIGDTNSEMVIPAVGVTRVAGGITWRTDLYGTFATNVAGETLTHPAAHLDVSGGCSADVHLDVEGSYIYRNVAGQFGACEGAGGVVGALRMRGSSWMQGYSRTYTTREDGGTFGEILPFYPPSGWPVQHFSGIDAGQRFRINVGLYNGLSVTTTYRLLLYDGNGALVAQHEVEIAPHASLQGPVASIMNAGNLAPGVYGLSVVPLGDGRSWAYISLVDNISGDPTNFW